MIEWNTILFFLRLKTKRNTDKQEMEGAKCDLDELLNSAMSSLPQDFQAEVQIEQETPAVQQSINALQGENHLDAFSAFFNESFKEVDDDEAHITKPETSTKRRERRNESSTSKRKTSKPDIVQDKEKDETKHPQPARKKKRKLNVEEKPTTEVDKVETKQINSIEHLINIQQFTDVESVLNNWLQQTLNIQAKLQKSHDLRILIDESIEKLRKDGLLTFIEYDKLRSIGNLWYELDEQIICYSLGTEDNKRRIIEILLSLYVLKQISNDLFLNTVMQL